MGVLLLHPTTGQVNGLFFLIYVSIILKAVFLS